jgi:alkylation response protein AidB-like acyl-CoA dehydrogenase
MDETLTPFVHPDAELSAEMAVFARRIRTFANNKLSPFARQVDEEVTFRAEMVQDLAQEGILGGPVANEFGGEAWTPMQIVVANEEVGAVCGNARGFMAVQSGLVAQCLERFGDQEQKAAWLPRLISGETIGCFGLTETEAGSDVASLQCRATPTDDGYQISGEKIWITNGGVADIALIFATVDPELGGKGITCFLVETNTPGLRSTPMEGQELGHRGSNHAQLIFDKATIEASAVVGGIGNGFKVAMGGLTCGRLSVAAGAVGIHRAALLASIEFVNQRQQFGKPIAAFQMVQERIADMTVSLMAARQLVYRCARARAAGTEAPGDLAAAKLFATEAASKAADTAIQLHGGRGYSTAYPVERLLRDSIGLRIYEGTSMIQKTILSRAVLRP